MTPRLLVLVAVLQGCVTSTSGQPDAGDAGQALPDAGAPDAGFVWEPAAPCPLERFEAMGVELHGEVWVMGGFTSACLLYTSDAADE